ncbi:exonuclease domain-containing protein [Georgenia sp. Z1344]|uniref:exonuclease domain-containing protein n=1 Tax=Georgenia sp. Z1344 TaxID=3416706 RepID=UPI003CEC84B0
MPGYAVIDLETTGFSHRNDRIIEIAVVHLDDDGRREAEFETLINPMRDLGPQHIHGIRASDARLAPELHAVVPTIVDLLAGRTLVAHNAGFDVPFLAAQLARIDVPVALSTSGALCTKVLAGTFLAGVRPSLESYCDEYGIAIDGHHRALADARATADLLWRYADEGARELPYWRSAQGVAGRTAWPRLDGVRVTPVVRGAGSRSAGVPTGTGDLESAAVPNDGSSPQESEHFLARIVDELPELGRTEAERTYLATLDRALADGVLTHAERLELGEVARMCDLAPATVARMHVDHVEAMAVTAWEDGYVTEKERVDLRRVARMLEVPEAKAALSLLNPPEQSTVPWGGEGGATTSPARQVSSSPAATPQGATPDAGASPSVTLAAGDRVVFTGQMRRGRDEWEATAAKRGLIPAHGITKAVRLLVAADPDTLSGKARKAEKYGIPIVDERTFEDMLEALAG